MSTQISTTEIKVAKTIAPDDLQRGDHVAILNEVLEYPSFLWPCASETHGPEDPIRIALRPIENRMPLKVVDFCLPFVFVKRPTGECETLDIRCTQLAKLDRQYAKRVVKALRKKRKRKRKS